MPYTKMIRWSGLLNSFISVLLLIWWCLLGAILVASGNLSLPTVALVRLHGYQLISLLGLLACVLAPLGLVDLYLPYAEKVGKMGLAGFLLSVCGVILYAAMQYEETFSWPILAVKAPAVLGSAGGLMSDPAYLAEYLVMGISFSLGFILLGLALRRCQSFPTWAVLCFTIGAPLFGIGMAVVIRSLGLLLWVAGWGWMGYSQWRKK